MVFKLLSARGKNIVKQVYWIEISLVRRAPEIMLIFVSIRPLQKGGQFVKVSMC